MSSRFFYILLLLLTCFVSAISQVMLKKAALREYNSLIQQYLNFRVITAYILFFLVIVGNTFILKYIPMSVMNPIAETLPYLISIFFGYVFFNEKITLRKICGSILISIGICILFF